VSEWDYNLQASRLWTDLREWTGFCDRKDDLLFSQLMRLSHTVIYYFGIVRMATVRVIIPMATVRVIIPMVIFHG
jgi:hypothetical protein